MSKTSYIVRSGLLTALVLAAQFLGKLFPAGAVILGPMSVTQLITGSLVNLIIIVAAVLVGLWSGVAVGVLSSVFATMLGIGPIFPIITPAIALGNAVIAAVVWFAYKYTRDSKVLKLAGILVGAGIKCAFLWITVPALLALIPEIKPAQLTALSLMFSWPQAITATVGGLLAWAILPVLSKAVSK